MDSFKFLMPAELSKSNDGEWIVEGLASTGTVDRQGEVIDQAGIDLTPVDQGKGWLNWDHNPGIENLLGTLDSYRRTSEGLFVKGRLFKNKEKSKAVYEVMSSLNKASDKARIGMSVEGKILQRDPKNPKIIKKCVIDKVAITLAPVNTDTYLNLVKSMGLETQEDLIKSLVSSDIQFDIPEVATESSEEAPIFTATQVLQIMQKALGVSSGNSEAPNKLSGGDALVQSTMKAPQAIKDEEAEPQTRSQEVLKKQKLKKMKKSLYKSNMMTVLDHLQVLYPEIPRTILWTSLQERLESKFTENN